MALFVLVHGTTAGGWVWKDVAARLRGAGHTVYTPTLTGLGERVHLASREVGLATHIDDVANTILYEDLNDLILVGHSYAGTVITGVANQLPERIRQLVYLDSVIAESGESCFDAVHAATQAEMAAQVQREGDGWLIPVRRGPNDLPSKNTPHPWKSWTDPLIFDPVVVRSLPTVYIRCTADKGDGEFFQLAMDRSWQRAQSHSWMIYEVDTVHQILPDPEPKARVLLELG